MHLNKQFGVARMKEIGTMNILIITHNSQNIVRRCSGEVLARTIIIWIRSKESLEVIMLQQRLSSKISVQRRFKDAMHFCRDCWVVEHSAFHASQVQENDIGVVVLQIPFGVQKFLPKEERASTFSDFPCFQQAPGSFLLLHVLEPMKQLELSQVQVTGLFHG